MTSSPRPAPVLPGAGPSPSPSPALPPGYALRPGVPPAPAYRHLRRAAGAVPARLTEAQAAGVAAGTWYGCHVVHAPTGAPVAMGRVVGDGAWYFHIADMVTLPEHQRKGLGSAVLKHLLAYIRENAPEDGEPFIGLFADPPGQKLYKRCGFVECLTSQEYGMVFHGTDGT